MTQPLLPNLPHQVVRASAGAGKTYQLTTRYLDLLVRREPPQQILATTFTRKAAGEVLGRVLGRLASACADPSQREQLAAALNQPELSQSDCLGMLRSLTDGLNRLAVGTIDGFFNRAARAMAMDLGLPPDPRIIDEGSPLAQQMRFDAIQAVLGEQAENDDSLVTLIEMLRRLHHDTAQRSVTEAIDSIVKDLGEVYRNYPEQSLWGVFPDTGQLDADQLNTAVASFEKMAPHLPLTKSGSVNQAFKKAYDAILSDARSGQWENLLANGLIRKVIAGESEFSRIAITDDWLSVIKPLLIHAMAVRLSALADQTRATYDLLALFDRHYQSTRYAQRVLLFSDLTYVLAEGLPGLGEAGVDELCFRLDAKVTHLLLDEFQDTSLRQWDVLEPFAQQITDNFEDSRSLFCVGDTKQAIYGWRGGCAELFDAVEALPGVEPTSLSDSYRSSQVVLDTVNDVFTGLVGNPALTDCSSAAKRWQQGFELHHAVKTDLPGHAVLHTTANGDSGQASDSEDDADAPPDAHAHYVAGYIRKMTEQLPGKTIGVLMRSRAKARTLMHALRSLGVHAAEEGGNPIGHDPAVAAVLAAIQFADHPGDKVARFHVANSPIGELLGMNQEVHPESIALGLRRSLIDQGYAAVIAGWVTALAPSCNAISLRRLMQLIELAEQHDEEGATLRPGFFVQSVQAAKVEDASPAPVRVMTIHASKGLEFDAVVLPDLDSTLSAQDSRDLIVLDRDSPIEPVRGLYRRLPKDLSSLTPALKRAHEQRAHEKRTEDLCLLYVAMTRARQALHMLVRPLKLSSNGKPTKTGLSNLSYAAILRQTLRSDDVEEGFEGGQCLYEAGRGDWHDDETQPDTLPAASTQVAPPIKLVERPEAQVRSWVKSSPSQMHDHATVKASELLNLQASGGQRYGTLVHAMLECVGFIDEGVPTIQELCQAASPVDSPGIDLEQTAGMIRQAMSSPAALQVLQRNGADVLWRERRFMVRIDDRLVTGSYDRVHLWYSNGKPIRAVLIDYKTDRVDDGTVADVVERYSEQIQLYRKALSMALQLDAEAIQAKLYFIGDSRVVDVL